MVQMGVQEGIRVSISCLDFKGKHSLEVFLRMLALTGLPAELLAERAVVEALVEEVGCKRKGKLFRLRVRKEEEEEEREQ
jgi:hypothetical protein